MKSYYSVSDICETFLFHLYLQVVWGLVKSALNMQVAVEVRSYMATNWKAIASAFERHQRHLDKAQSAVSLLKEQLAEKPTSTETSKHINQMLEIERDIRVTRNRISSFIENHCKQGEITKKWLARRDSISEQFSFVSNKTSNLCSQAIQYITATGREDGD